MPGNGRSEASRGAAGRGTPRAARIARTRVAYRGLLMADYVSILRRTLDGLGSGATPALRERVYGRARDAVLRQLDGMVPPPAEEVKARQIEQLESAIREVEAGYGGAEGDPAAPTPDAAPSPTNEIEPPAEAAAGASPEPRPVPEPAPTPPPAPDPVPAPEPPAPEPIAGPNEGASEGADVGPSDPLVRPDGGEEIPPADAPDLPPVADLPPSPHYAAPLPDGDPLAADASGGDAYGGGGASEPARDGFVDDQPLAPAAERHADEPEVLDGDGPVGGDLALEGAPRVAMIGPGGGAVLDPALAVPLGPVPDAASFAAGDGGDDGAVGDAMGIATGADDATRPADGPDRPNGDPFDPMAVETLDPPGPPASTLASGAAAMPRPAPLDPVDPVPADLDAAPIGPAPVDAAPFDPARLDPAGGAAGASALALASGGRFDLPPELRSDGDPSAADPAFGDDGAVPALPRASDMPDALDADPADPLAAERFAADPLTAERPVAAEPTVASPTTDPIVVAPAAGAGDALSAQGSLEPAIADDVPPARADGPPDVPLAPPPGARRRGGGLLTTAVVLIGLLAGGYYLRDEIAEATGVEGFRTAFGVSPAIDGLLGRDTVAVAVDEPTPDTDPVDDDVVVADAPPDPATPADAPTTIVPTPPATDNPPPENTVVADAPPKFQDQLPTDGTVDGAGDGPVDAAPGPNDVTSTTVPVVPTDGDGTPVADGAGDEPGNDATNDADDASGNDATGNDASGTEVAAADPAPATPAAPAVPGPGEGRVFLVGEPVAGVSERAGGGVAWSVVEASPGSGLPPEPAIRGDVTLEDGSAVEVTVRRNADDTLPASHLIEIVFALPDGGRTVSRLPLVGFKDALNVPARPLVAVPAKITDEFFVVGLNSLQSAVDSNIALMREEAFMDVQLVDGENRRATLTLEKGERGTEVFAEVLEAWAGAPLPG